MSLSDKIDKSIREVPDFPKPGIMFKDITPILTDPGLISRIVAEFALKFEEIKIDAIIGIESRGFLFGMALAQKMKLPFLMVRKKGKLPGDTIEYSYALEYGEATIEMHTNSIMEGWNVLIHDDLLATGGTAGAAAQLVELQKGQVAGFSFVIELGFLEGRKKLIEHCETIVSLKTY